MYQIFFKESKLITILFLAIQLLAIDSYCQSSGKADSLQKQLSGSKGQQRGDILYGLAYELFYVNKKQALTYANEAYDFSLSIGDSSRIVSAGRIKGQLLRNVDSLSKSISILSEVLNIAKRNQLQEEEKKILNALAIAHTYQANYDKALLYHYKSLAIREHEGNKDEISIAFNNIGFVYFKLKNYQKAIEYYERCLKLKEEIGGKENIDLIFINLGLCFNQLNDFKTSRDFFTRAFLTCANKCSDQIKLEGKLGLGLANFGLGNYDEAEVFFQESLVLSKQNGNKRFQIENLLSLGRIYTIKKNDSLAQQALMQSERLAIVYGYNELLIETYKVFSMLYNSEGDFENAAVYQAKYIEIKDSIYNELLIGNLTKIHTDFAERENIATIASKNIVIKQQRDLNFAVAIIAILAGLLILVLQRSNRTIKKVNVKLSEAKEVIQEQNKLLESQNKYLDKEVESKSEDLERANQSLKQVNDELDNFIYKTSHDIRGPLASLKGMCNVALMDVKDPVALDYLQKLDITAERLNTILTRLLIINQINNSKLTIAKVEFVHIVNDVLMLEKKKGLPQKLTIHKHIDPLAHIQSDRELIRIVLENLIDNAIKFFNDSDRVDSFVSIFIDPLNDGQVKIRVIDNGIGISEENPGKLFRMFFRASERSETGGIGLYIVKTATAKLGGKVGLLTTPEGHTEFYVIFPAVPPTADDFSEKPSI